MFKLVETEQRKETSKILVLYDEHSIHRVLEHILSQAGYIRHLTKDVPEARQVLRKHPIQLA